MYIQVYIYIYIHTAGPAEPRPQAPEAAVRPLPIFFTHSK